MEKFYNWYLKSRWQQKVFSVTDPRDDVTADEAKTAMETVIAADIFAADGIGLTEAVEARVRTTEVNVLA